MNDDLKKLRQQIDTADDELLQILARRVDIVRQVGLLKKANNMASLDEKRWRELLESNLLKAGSLNLSGDFIRKLYNLIHEYSLEIETKNK